jgi:hypothetical protein
VIEPFLRGELVLFNRQSLNDQASLGVRVLFDL